MLDLLDRLDARTAAGVLAEAALRLDGRALSFSGSLVENQEQLEAAIVDDLRRELHLTKEDISPSALSALTDALDARAESLVASIGNSSSLSDLSARGLLPSDVYSVSFGEHLAQNLGSKWRIEQRLASITISNPHKEQRLGEHAGDTIPAPVTLFARYFWHRYPAKGFWLLVLCSRNAINLQVDQVWRLYPKDVDPAQCENLVDAIKAFADRFGQVVDLDGQKGNFFLSLRKSALRQPTRNLKVFSGKPGHTVTITIFDLQSSASGFAHLIVPVISLLILTLSRNGVDGKQTYLTISALPK